MKKLVFTRPNVVAYGKLQALTFGLSKGMDFENVHMGTWWSVM